MRKDILLVGGPMDGQTVSVDTCMYEIYAYQYPPICARYNPIPEEYEAFVYHIQPFRGNSRRYEIGALKGMTADELIERLIKGYRKSD